MCCRVGYRSRGFPFRCARADPQRGIRRTMQNSFLPRREIALQRHDKGAHSGRHRSYIGARSSQTKPGGRKRRVNYCSGERGGGADMTRLPIASIAVSGRRDRKNTTAIAVPFFMIALLRRHRDRFITRFREFPFKRALPVHCFPA